MAAPEEETPICRSIKVLRREGEPAEEEEVREAALQYVRKISGSRGYRPGTLVTL